MCCTLATCCCCSLSVILGALVAFVALIPSGDSSPKCFPNADVERVLPLAPTSYPEEFQGILWMDQGGIYGHSDIPLGAPDLALSFGDTGYSKWDPTTRTMSVDVAGPAWTWMNSGLGYVFYTLMNKAGFFYLFELNLDGTVIQVYPSLNLGQLGKFSLPARIMSFTMEKVVHPKGACPPTGSTSKKDIVKCATWDRVSKGFFSPLVGSYGVLHYYVWKIVDGQGNKLQPYYDAYMQFADQSCAPSSTLRGLVGITDASCSTCSTAFHGVREKATAASAPATKSSEL